MLFTRSTTRPWITGSKSEAERPFAPTLWRKAMAGAEQGLLLQLAVVITMLIALQLTTRR